jgi:methionine-rich copper-binding protein CopC
MRPSSLAIAAAVALSLLGGRAFAHAQLVKADPKVGATVGKAPGRLWLQFDQVLRLAGSGVQLVYPDGHAVLLTPLKQDPGDVRAVVAPLPANLPKGRYEVRWRALSPDAHHTQGDFSFTVGG